MRWIWWTQRSFITSPSLAVSQRCCQWLVLCVCVHEVCVFCDGGCIYSLVTTLKLCSRQLWEFYVFKNKKHQAKARMMSSCIYSPKSGSFISELSFSYMYHVKEWPYMFSTADGTSIYHRNCTHTPPHQSHTTNYCESKNNDWLVSLHVIPMWPSLAHKWTGLVQLLL